MTNRRGGRRPEPRIVDLELHPRDSVSLIVAAEFLHIDPRTLVVRIEERKIAAWRDGRVWRINLSDLRDYVQRHRLAS